MSNLSQKIARQYTDAMYRICRENKIFDSVMEDISKILRLLSRLETVEKILYMQWIPKEQKLAIWDVVKRNLEISSQYVVIFVETMIEHHRLDLLPKVAQLLQDKFYDDKGYQPFCITTAYDLDDKTKEAIKTDIEGIIDSKIIPEFEIDQKILDGIVIESKGKILDLSFRKRLDLLQKSI